MIYTHGHRFTHDERGIIMTADMVGIDGMLLARARGMAMLRDFLVIGGIVMVVVGISTMTGLLLSKGTLLDCGTTVRYPMSYGAFCFA